MRSKPLGEEIMERIDERRVTRRVRISRPRWVSGLASEGVRDDLHLQATGRDFDFSPPAQLPPTRAARTPRSRGVFSEVAEAPKKQSAWRRADLSVVAFAVAVVAIASALIVGAPIAISGAGPSFNPGPAIVGAASVPPAFIGPTRTR
jgi:hypothetical protein